MCHWLRTIGLDCWLSYLLNWGCRIGPMVSWILWSGLLNSQDWVLYSVTELEITFPALVGQQDKAQSPYSLFTVGPIQAWMGTEIPGQAKPPVLLCRWRKLQAVFSIQGLLCVGLSHILHSFLCALVRSPGWAGWRLYSAMSGAMN